MIDLAATAEFYSYVIQNKSFMNQLLALNYECTLKFFFSYFFVFNAEHLPLNWFYNPLISSYLQFEKHWPGCRHSLSCVWSPPLHEMSCSWMSTCGFGLAPELRLPTCLLSVVRTQGKTNTFSLLPTKVSFTYVPWMGSFVIQGVKHVGALPPATARIQSNIKSCPVSLLSISCFHPLFPMPYSVLYLRPSLPLNQLPYSL